MSEEGRSGEKILKQKPLWIEVQWISPLISIIVWASIAGWALSIAPNSRYLDTYNPKISEATSHPFHHDTISYGLLLGLAAAVGVIVPFVVECFVERHPMSKRQFYITLVNLWLGCLEAVLLTIATTEAIKFNVGFLRPNFASVCQPRLVNGSTYECTTNPSEYHKSMVSFPSGHASTGTAVGWYTSLYLLWNLYHRHEGIPSQARAICQQALFLPALAPFLLALAVSVSRVTDFKHHTIDITMGTVLGLVFASVVFFRAVKTLPGRVVVATEDD
ncbi:hypothetical protein LEN26_020338 [Aphanomyces euteiches]|nr:hypothetical protein LEN26_020338 [Aphanomyces euteiches]KAH9129408.1 hypothetical protein AeMF1_000514 [Aphanomyces euteiches]KAH9195022.1 hypothetical protein AeNC1_003015 [Aphanomyces euteiches]